jgi:hypothetical protein
MEKDNRYSATPPADWDDGIRWGVDPGPEAREAARLHAWAYRGYTKEAIERIFEESRQAQKELSRLTVELAKKRGFYRGF